VHLLVVAGKPAAGTQRPTAVNAILSIGTIASITRTRLLEQLSQ
jgi:hypothetical protein